MKSAVSLFPDLKTIAQNPQRLDLRNNLCPGCGINMILSSFLRVTSDPIVIANATGCSEICLSPFPETFMKCSWIHSLFENSASVISGVESAFNVFSRKNLLTKTQKKTKFLAIGGDGASSDIGLQWISGAVERGHDFTYLCLDNEGYMNTGAQRSSSVPRNFATTTSPLGKRECGKAQPRKNLTSIMIVHDISYVAQINPAFNLDLMKKAHKAFETKGPSFINSFSPCPTEWKHAPEQGITIARLATESGLWPLYEVYKGKYRINHKSTNHISALKEFFSLQKRTKHLLEKKNREIFNSAVERINLEWEKLLKLEQTFPWQD